MDQYFKLNNKICFITGGGSGIGLAVAKRFKSAGADVIIADINDASAIAKEESLHYVKIDVSNEESVKNAFNAIQQKYGEIDILINNAGIGDLPGNIIDADTKAWEKIIDINFKGAMYVLKYGAQTMSKEGRIINTASQSAITKIGGMEPYSATKSALVSLTKTLALELGHKGINVNAISPSNTKTPMMMKAEDAEYAELFSKHFSPSKRVGTTEDLVGVFHFLASDESFYINGQNIIVDGGWTAGISNQAIEGAVFKRDEV